MPLDAARLPDDDPQRRQLVEALVDQVMADPVFKQCVTELWQQALDDIGDIEAVRDREHLRALIERGPFRRRLFAVGVAVFNEQQAGWCR